MRLLQPLSKGLAFAIIWLFAGCQSEKSVQEKTLSTTTYHWNLPDHFPEPEVPADNAMTQERVDLGRRLFYEPLLSLDSTISCANCHQLPFAFSDPDKVSAGVHGRRGFRNSPTLTNIAYNEHFFFDGGIPSLELQVLAPLDNADEMQLNIHKAALRLREDSTYLYLFQKAYGRQPDSYSIVRALAAFERTMISANSPYDRWVQGDSSALTPAAQRGLQLFMSDNLQCSQCHSGFNFTNNGFAHNGLHSDYSNDPGRRRVTMKESDVGKFKVPTLRNVEVSAPYMHDGSIPTLVAVIDHYASGGQPHPNKSPLITGFSLTDDEKHDLIAFLHSLTDQSFLSHPKFLPQAAR